MTDSIDQLLAEMDDICTAEPSPACGSYLSPFRPHNINAACFRRNANNREDNDPPESDSGPSSSPRHIHPSPGKPLHSSPPPQITNAACPRRTEEQSPVTGSSSSFRSPYLPQNIHAFPARRSNNGRVFEDNAPFGKDPKPSNGTRPQRLQQETPQLSTGPGSVRGGGGLGRVAGTQLPSPRANHSYNLSVFLHKTPPSAALSPRSGTESSSLGLLSSPVPARQYENPFKTPESASRGRQARLAAFQASNLAKHSESLLEGFRFQGGLQNTQSSPAPSVRGSQPVQCFNPREALQSTHSSVPTAKDVPLVPIDRLPVWFRSVFPYPQFNAVQSRCFDSAYNSPDNLVVSAPTGSGKTAVLELAICALLREHRKGTYKVVYQAPTKALCSERKRDWGKKFGILGLTCTELTGDTTQERLPSALSGDLIVTTPEKWDSMTRGWRDRNSVDLVRLFLIDEVHALKEGRGATLEVVVSRSGCPAGFERKMLTWRRMRSTKSDVRFVALSATIPNAPDICSWLGRGPSAPDTPAKLEIFGSEFRPVKLQKYVYGFPCQGGNDFGFDKTLDRALPELVRKHGSGKPVMLFCMTRSICESTARLLAGTWSGLDARHKPWMGPRKRFRFRSGELQYTASCGVAFHHAGVEASDRSLVENLYLEGELNVICCTSTLAVGVNLPAYLVILKNTVTWSDGVKEYVDLEVMQMLGRAGRPQFGDTGVVVIMTAKNKVAKYERMTEGTETLESSLHENLVEHMNAEIGLRTITDTESAKRWLRSTFLHVRLKKNPRFYKLDDQTATKNSEERLNDICEKELGLLLKEGLVMDNGGKLSLTKFGEAMARDYIKFKTMRLIINMPPRAGLSKVLTILSEAEEFGELRFRAGEKGFYKDMNTRLVFPIKEEPSTPGHKVVILIQHELAMLEDPREKKLQVAVTQDKAQIFKHSPRIVRCIIDCQQEKRDAGCVLHALQLARCLQGRAWEDSPSELRQLSYEEIDVDSVGKLKRAGFRSILDIVEAQPHQIETALSRGPPLGTNFLQSANRIPQFTLSSKRDGPVKRNSTSKLPEVRVQAEVKIKNFRTVQRYFNGAELSIVFIAERSDGYLVHFQRQTLFRVSSQKAYRFSAQLESMDQFVRCHVACEQIGIWAIPICHLMVWLPMMRACLLTCGEAGTWKTCELEPAIDPSMFLKVPPKEKQVKRQRKYVAAWPNPSSLRADSDEDYGDTSIFDHIDFELLCRRSAKTAQVESSQPVPQPIMAAAPGDPVQLANGKWQCRHKCANKGKCKHACCYDGLDNPYGTSNM